MAVRKARTEDLEEIVRIYNQAVETKKSTAVTAPDSGFLQDDDNSQKA